MKKTLNGFYAQGNELINELNSTKERIKDIANPFESVSLGSPLVMADSITLRLFEAFLLTNTHFVPGKKPAIGIAIGDFIKDKEEKEYVTIDSAVMFANIRYLHIARLCEPKLIAWDGVKTEIHENLSKLLDLVQVHYPGFVKEFSLTEFYDACGLQYASTPSTQFVEGLISMKERLSDSDIDTALIELAGSIIDLCAPFTTVAQEMFQLRSVVGTKGHLTSREEHLGMSAPSASGGASWLQLTGDDIANALPGDNNLFVLSAHAGKSSMDLVLGSGSATDRSITFLVPTMALKKLQQLVDSNSILQEKWNSCSYMPGESAEEISHKVNNWWKLVHDALITTAQEVITETVHSNILGLQLDMSNENGVAILRPVVSEFFFLQNKDCLTDLDLQEPLTDLYKDILVEHGDGYYKSKSIFDTKVEA